jgi:hypothetical protein
MFSPFKKVKKAAVGEPINQEKTADRIVQNWIRVQAKWAGLLQHQSEKFSCRTKKYSLLLFCVVSVGSSLYVFMEGFHDSTPKNIPIAQINVPLHAVESGKENISSFLLITRGEFNRIEKFSRYIDSLGLSKEGRRLRDSILSYRPGLMDSIGIIKKIYQSQSLKK